MLAVNMGSLGTVQELRQLGASYELRDRSGSTALHWACLSKNPQLVDWMLQDGAEVSVTNDLGRTPLMLLGMKMLQSLFIYYKIVQLSIVLKSLNAFNRCPN